jgi:hypothetical protein
MTIRDQLTKNPVDTFEYARVPATPRELWQDGYFTLRVFIGGDSAWHPTEADVGGPFEVRTVGAFRTYPEACTWAETKLGSNYSATFISAK